jgi:hypothetical protein
MIRTTGKRLIYTEANIRMESVFMHFFLSCHSESFITLGTKISIQVAEEFHLVERGWKKFSIK